MSAPLPLDQWRRAMALEKARILREARVVVEVGANHVKADARRNSATSSGKSARRAPASIIYDIARSATSVSASIYYSDRDQGKLGTVLEFGGGRDHSPPHRDVGRALDAEDPRFVNALANVATIGSVDRT